MFLNKTLSIVMTMCLLLLLAGCGLEGGTATQETPTEPAPDRKAQHRAEQLSEQQSEAMAEQAKQLEAAKERFKAMREAIMKQGGKWLDSRVAVLDHQTAFQSEATKKFLSTLLELYLPLASGSVDVVPVTAAYQPDGSLQVVLMVRNGREGKTLTHADFAKASLVVLQADGAKIAEAPFTVTSEDIGSLRTGDARPLHFVIDKKHVHVNDYFFANGYLFVLQGL
jgi:SLAP domain-containing protein